MPDKAGALEAGALEAGALEAEARGAKALEDEALVDKDEPGVPAGATPAEEGEEMEPGGGVRHEVALMGDRANPGHHNETGPGAFLLLGDDPGCPTPGRVEVCGFVAPGDTGV